MSQETLKIGLLGMGTVGGGVASIIERRGDMLRDKSDINLEIERILVRNPGRSRSVELPHDIYTTDPADILENPEIKIVVELIGGIEPARSYIAKALEQGKYVVTANKDLMALKGVELLELARRCGRNILYEASVGGGIPLIRPLKYCLVANDIHRIIGIINGTTNYILTSMTEEKAEFTVALDKARVLGFAEADPTSDLEGLDAANKLAILSRLAFNSSVNLDDIYIQGIRSVTREDICYARELGYAIKLLAVGERLEEGLAMRVHPTLVPLDHPLASVRHEYNAIFIEGDAVGEVMFYGRGAGAQPTASSVLADVLEAARHHVSQVGIDIGENNFRNLPALPVTALTARFYFRLLAEDRPGVFAALATAFGEDRVSLDMIIQKRSERGMAEIVLLTHDVLEEQVNRALIRVMDIPAIQKELSIIRVL